MSDITPLSETHPHLAIQADGWDPSEFVAGSAQKMNWECELGHKWSQVIRERIRRNNRGLCPTCDNKILLAGFNDLATTNPELIVQANGWDPKSVTNASTRKAEWKCQHGHEWTATVHSRARLGKGCPICANVKLLAGFNDLKTRYPDIASEADGWDPTEVITGSAQRKKWKCKSGHCWEASVNSRTSRNTKCNVCNGRVVSSGFNDLATIHPKLAMEADGWDPRTVLPGSRKSRAWQCKKGHKWNATVESRAKLNRGCGVCSGNQVLAGFNDLLTTHPEVARSLVEGDPTTISAGSERRYKWQCSLGHRWSAAVKNISRGQGCPYCANYKLLSGFNDFATKYPLMALEADGWDPSKVVAGSAVKKNWKCAEGHKYSTLVSSRSSRNTGCPSCANSGFDPNKDGWLYFLVHPVWEMLQIGITNVPDERLSTHKRLGWELLELQGPMNGDLARQWEVDILRMLKIQHAELGNSNIAGKFTGYTESWIRDSYPAKSLKELMSSVRSQDW